ncbi:MAG: peptide-methionine (S)-S-oxide reductase MsrA [Gemmatimonadota bacterium]|jgi:peptide-methionine (S)-S-oxide reductase|nr:peptide-methionine (S)-S-oxide reductase MsrA [Gemmatimonadota bacterium]
MNQIRRATATFGGGCFWCLEAAFSELSGVLGVESGYAGGPLPYPSYEQVCSGVTGHAEVVRVVFDPAVISYRELLEVFFLVHDPTTLNRQGADVGTQYRSVIFTHNEEQRRDAEEMIRELGEAHIWRDPIVTELLPAPEFFPAESYHQRYFERNPGQGYCQVVIAPKLAKLRAGYAAKLKSARDGEPPAGE